MRLSDLVGASVVDASGSRIGAVLDVRLCQDALPVGPSGAALRVDGLIVGRVGLSSRLGYDRAGVDAPWLVATIARRAHRSTRYLPWRDVVEVEGRIVRAAVTEADLVAPSVLSRGAGSP
jgi:hypothetical protein